MMILWAMQAVILIITKNLFKNFIYFIQINYNYNSQQS